MTRTQPGTGEKCQAAKSLKFDLYQVLRWKVSRNHTDSKPFLRAKQKPKTNRRWVKLASKRSMSVIVDFQADDYFELWQDRARRREKRQRTPDRRLGRRKLQLKCEFCFVFQRSFADKFSVSWAFLLHEQRVSLRLPLSVLSDIIISRNEQFLFYLLIFIYLFHFHCISFVPKK